MATARRSAAPAAAPAARATSRREAEPPAGRRRAAAPASEVIQTNFRGAAGLRKREEVEAKNDAQREAGKAMAGAPFRYFVPAGEIGELVIVDEAPDFFRTEHAMMNPRSKRWDLFVPCIDGHANCPACAVAERPAYYAMYLTVIDLVPYTNRDGVEVPFSKKLLVIKPMQQKKFIRYYEKHKTLRGMHLEMTRDNKKEASIGDPDFLDFIDEEELQSYIYDYEDQEGKLHEVICDQPFDYDAIFPEPTEKHIRALVGGRPEAGSREDDDRALGRAPRGRAARNDDWEGEEETAPRAARRGAPERAAAPSRRPAPRDEAPAPRAANRRAAPPVEEDAEEGPPWDEDDLPDSGEDIPPTRGAARGSARPAARQAAPARAPARRPAREEAETVEYDDVPQRPARGRAPPADDGYDEADRNPPARNGAGVAARRASLRR